MVSDANTVTFRVYTNCSEHFGRICNKTLLTYQQIGPSAALTFRKCKRISLRQWHCKCDEGNGVWKKKGKTQGKKGRKRKKKRKAEEELQCGHSLCSIIDRQPPFLFPGVSNFRSSSSQPQGERPQSRDKHPITCTWFTQSYIIWTLDLASSSRQRKQREK